jgi:hypothetical protein
LEGSLLEKSSSSSYYPKLLFLLKNNFEGELFYIFVLDGNVIRVIGLKFGAGILSENDGD